MHFLQTCSQISAKLIRHILKNYSLYIKYDPNVESCSQILNIAILFHFFGVTFQTLPLDF